MNLLWVSPKTPIPPKCVTCRHFKKEMSAFFVSILNLFSLEGRKHYEQRKQTQKGYEKSYSGITC